MMRNLLRVCCSLLVALWATASFAQKPKPMPVREWRPASPETGRHQDRDRQEQDDAGMEEGQAVLGHEGTQAPVVGRKGITLSPERKIRKRLGPGPVA